MFEHSYPMQKNLGELSQYSEFQLGCVDGKSMPIEINKNKSQGA